MNNSNKSFGKKKFSNSNFKGNKNNFKSNNKFSGSNNNSNSSAPSNHRKVLLDRYEKFFGFGASQKLLSSVRDFSNNQFIRVNLSKCSVSEIEKFLVKNRVKYDKTFLPNAFKINKSFFNLSSSVFALTGKIYFQDLASQVPINCVDFDRLKKISDSGRVVKVLDGCASPGSKTTQMLDLLNFHEINYEMVALEIDLDRVNRLVNNIQKLGFSGFKVFNVSGQDFKTSEQFDVMILDVPCSGNLVGDRGWINKRCVSDICDKSNLQKSIVKNLVKYLRSDGELIYSTCSIEPEEDEMNVKWIVDNCSVSNVKINLKLPFETKCLDGVFGLRFLPFRSKTQGFFVAKFFKK